jgi:hypothetical protein
MNLNIALKWGKNCRSHSYLSSVKSAKREEKDINGFFKTTILETKVFFKVSFFIREKNKTLPSL